MTERGRRGRFQGKKVGGVVRAMAVVTAQLEAIGLFPDRRRFTAHPEASGFAAWYLATIRCGRTHSLGLGLGDPWPCAECLEWAAEVTATALSTIEKPKSKGRKKCRENPKSLSAPGAPTTRKSAPPRK